MLELKLRLLLFNGLKKVHNSPISCKRDSTTLGRSMDNVSDALNLGQSYGGS